MARFANTFQAQTPIGSAIQSLADAMFGGPSPVEMQSAQVDADYKRALTQQAQYGVKTDQMEMASRGTIADMLAGLVPGADGAMPMAFGAPAYAEAVRGGYDPQDLAEAIRGLAASGGFSDDSLIRAMAGAGTPIPENSAVSLGGQDNVRAANAINEINARVASATAGAQATPLTEAQIRAQVLQDYMGQPTWGERDTRVLLGVQSPPDMDSMVGPDNTLMTRDTNDPYGVASQVPIVGPGGELAPFAPQGTLPTAGQETEATSTRRTLEARAASLGITPSELDWYLIALEQVKAALGDTQILGPEGRDAFEAINAKMLGTQQMVPGVALPPGYQVIQ